MANNLYNTMYNPDVLSCIANLSSDEVFTPPEAANAMLDLLPKELFKSPDTTFLDPCCKSGVFLREIAKRLLSGLEDVIPDLKERTEHIFKKQLYGIAITEITSHISRRSIYCSKTANGNYSVVDFDTVDGNIRFKTIQHKFKNGKCVFCGAAESEYGREKRGDLETHAYELIHTVNPEEIFNMKFDVIIGNPPYQLSTGSSTQQATPLYDKFVKQSFKLDPNYIVMIIPARWYAGGMGLDSFREFMLTNKKIKKIVDFPNSKDCFPGMSIGGGVCYFLYDKNHNGECEFVNIANRLESKQMRILDEFPVFIRYNKAISIVHKAAKFDEENMSTIASTLNPFDIPSSERGNEEKTKDDLILYSSKGKGYYPYAKLKKGKEYVNKYKVMISKVIGEHAGEPSKDGTFKVISRIKLLKPEEICTFSYFLIGNFSDISYAENCLTYLSTKFVRFLLLQSVSSINLSKEKFQFIPIQDFSKPWTDEELYKKYDLRQEEIDFIESMIKPMEIGETD